MYVGKQVLKTFLIIILPLKQAYDYSPKKEI